MTRRRVAARLVTALGLAAASGAWMLPGWRDGDGWFRGVVVVGVAVGVALALVGIGLACRAARFATWTGVLIVGQAVALQLVRAGNAVRYQHLPSLRELADPGHSLWLGWIAVQAAAVGFAFWRRRRPIADLLRGAAGRGTWMVTAAMLALGAATVSPDPADFLGELAFAALLTAIQAATLLVALSWAPERLLAALGRRLAAVVESARAPRLAACAAMVATLVAMGLQLAVYQRHPHVPDEVAYLLHARMLAQGSLTLPAPPVPEGFELYLVEVADGRRFPVPPPGWPTILALGFRAGVPWLVNPLLAGLVVWLAYRLIAALYDRRIALLAAWLLALSPWHLFLGMSWMTHAAALAAALGATLCLLRCARGAAFGWCALAGILVGVVAAIRPLDGVIVAVVLAPLVLAGRRTTGVVFARLVACAVGGLLVGAALLVYNARLTGDPLRMPIQQYIDLRFAPGANDYGFGANRGMGWPLDPNPGHSPIDALINSDLNGFALNVELFGWSVGSLLFAGLALFSSTRRRGDLALIATSAVVYGAHFFYYFSGGPDFGPRYWYLMIVPLVALTARGIQEAGERLGGRLATAGPDSRPLLAAALLVLSSMATFVPWRAIDKYRNYRGMRPDVREIAERQGLGRSLVLVRGAGHPDYASAAIYNPLDLNADAPVYAWDRSPEVRAAVLAAYRDRPVWLLDGPTVTGRGFRVAAGPISAETLLRPDIHADGGPP